MTCKAGTKLLRKVAVPTVAAIALMLCTTPSARAQAGHGQYEAMIMMLPDGNMYSCEIDFVGTPSEVNNWSCQATLMMGTPVKSAVESEGMAMVSISPMFGLGFWVDVEERPDGTANVKAHFTPHLE